MCDVDVPCVIGLHWLYVWPWIRVENNAIMVSSDNGLLPAVVVYMVRILMVRRMNHGWQPLEEVER